MGLFADSLAIEWETASGMATHIAESREQSERPD
jgi:hypothetical protein